MKKLILILVSLLFLVSFVNAVSYTLTLSEATSSAEKIFNVGGKDYKIELYYGNDLITPENDFCCWYWVVDQSTGNRERVKPNSACIDDGESYNLQVFPLKTTMTGCQRCVSDSGVRDCISRYQISQATIELEESVPTGEECITPDTWKCDENKLYAYDSCGNQKEMWYDCTSLGLTCSESERNCVNTCTPKSYKGCLASNPNNVIWYDSCNVAREIAETCQQGWTCVNAQCVKSCVTHSYKFCNTDHNVWWRNSCNEYEGIAERCLSNECYEGKCVAILCSSHKSKICEGNSLWWYNSCGNREDMIERCNSSSPCVTPVGCVKTEHCGDGACNYGEVCNTCVIDCGECKQGEFCGDWKCNNNETCDTCSQDCGVCKKNVCQSNENCKEDEICQLGECKKNVCGECEYIKDHVCIKKYECCNNEECESKVCNQEIHKCEQPIKINGDVLIVTVGSKLNKNNDYYNTLNEYQNVLESEGLTSSYVELDSKQVENLFSIQLVNSDDWNNVKEVLDKLIIKIQPKYLVILGGVDVIPMPPAETTSEIPTIPVSDDRYADIDFDGLPDIAIGRIPTVAGSNSVDIIIKALNSAIKMHNKREFSKVILTDICLFPPTCDGIEDVNKISMSIFNQNCLDNNRCYSAPPYCSGKTCTQKEKFYEELQKNDIINLNAHADPYGFSASTKEGWYDVLVSSELYKRPFTSNPTFSTIGCHSSTIDCEEEGCITEDGNVYSFLMNGASIYVGNTRYGMGGISANLLSDYYINLKNGMTSGDAILKMKRDNLVNSMTDFENAVIYEIQLYGDPTLKVEI
ncbi:MAG: C25 family cysteine peptidase [Candidatus Nanoarchaeia archaeon]